MHLTPPMVSDGFFFSLLLNQKQISTTSCCFLLGQKSKISSFEHINIGEEKRQRTIRQQATPVDQVPSDS